MLTPAPAGAFCANFARKLVLSPSCQLVGGWVELRVRAHHPSACAVACCAVDSIVSMYQRSVDEYGQQRLLHVTGLLQSVMGRASGFGPCWPWCVCNPGQQRCKEY